MTKAEILAEIGRTAAANGGIALGLRTFTRETGIRHADWFGIYWRSWGDAVREAGLTANTLTPKIDENELLRRYSLLARELGRFPTKGDLRLKKRRDATFPSDGALVRRFGTYASTRLRAHDYCVANTEFADVVPLLTTISSLRATATVTGASVLAVGFVYLVKHGSRPEYKIGMTRNPLRREGEMRLELPEKLNPVHYIATDDPAGIEAYWHARFASKRKQGEWFALTKDDIAAFKRWKRIT